MAADIPVGWGLAVRTLEDYGNLVKCWAAVPPLIQIFFIAPNDHAYNLMWPIFCLSLRELVFENLPHHFGNGSIRMVWWKK